MKALIHAGLKGRGPIPSEKQFLISSERGRGEAVRLELPDEARRLVEEATKPG